MLHSRIVTLDASGTSAVGSASVPPARYSGVYYQFSDPTQTGTITVSNKGLQLFTKSGAANGDGIQEYDTTKTREAAVSGRVVVDTHSITGGNPGDTLTVALYFDFGGAG